MVEVGNVEVVTKGWVEVGLIVGVLVNGSRADCREGAAEVATLEGANDGLALLTAARLRK